MNKLIIFFVVFFLGACGSQAPKDDISANGQKKIVEIIKPKIESGDYYLVLPKDKQLDFYGELKLSNSSKHGANQIGMPGDALFAAIAASSQVSKARAERKAKREQAREEAAKVLVPYQDKIDSIATISELADRNFYSLTDNLDANFNVKSMDSDFVGGNVWKVDISPIFVMSHTEDSISVITSVNISESMDSLGEAANKSKNIQPQYTRKIAVQSYPIEDMRTALSNREDFRITLQKLLATSIDLALKDFIGVFPERSKLSTVRYLNNGTKRVERAYELSETCKHVLFESLKKEMKLLPLANSSGSNCEVQGLLTSIL